MRTVEGLSVRDIADELGVSHMCIWRLVKDQENGSD
ncbi:MAG: helix-turn-helix domain-containing protein [Candidatus Micrarchaeota archaeon]